MTLKLCNCGYFTPISGIMGPNLQLVGCPSRLWDSPLSTQLNPTDPTPTHLFFTWPWWSKTWSSWWSSPTCPGYGNLLPWSQVAQGERVFPIGKDRLPTTILQGRTVKPSGVCVFFRKRLVFFRRFVDSWILRVFFLGGLAVLTNMLPFVCHVVLVVWKSSSTSFTYFQVSCGSCSMASISLFGSSDPIFKRTNDRKQSTKSMMQNTEMVYLPAPINMRCSGWCQRPDIVKIQCSAFLISLINV